MQDTGLTFQLKWAKTREKGKWNYIFRHGILSWGLPFAVGFLLVIILKNSIENWLLAIPLLLIIYLTGGLLIGFINWHINEKIFRKIFK